MSSLEAIRAEIPDFPGCEGEEDCRLSDEQVRSYVGERISALVSGDLAPADRELCDRVLFRCEFMNQEAFRIFDEDRNERRIAAVLEADAALLAAAKKLDSPEDGFTGVLTEIDKAFDQRDAAMRAA